MKQELRVTMISDNAKMHIILHKQIPQLDKQEIF